MAIEAQSHNVITTDFIYTIYEQVDNQSKPRSKTNTLSYGKVPTYKLISISFVDKICAIRYSSGQVLEIDTHRHTQTHTT